MLYIKRGQTNNISVTLTQNSLPGFPYYLFSFENILSKDTITFFPQNITTASSRYDEFRFVETDTPLTGQTPPQVTFLYEGDYYYTVYQMGSTGSTNPSNSIGVVEQGRALVSGDTIGVFYTQFISDNENNNNIIFLSSQEDRT
jgi:hypothetical protein